MICRHCGCSPAERCAVEIRQTRQGRPAKPGATRYGQTAPARLCSMHGDTCSRCATRHVTSLQVAELARIEARRGPIEWGQLRPDPLIWVTWRDRDDRARTVTLDADGRQAFDPAELAGLRELVA